MNWIEIKKNYPNAFDCCSQHFYEPASNVKFYEEYWNNRLLYTFFDENGINIAVSNYHPEEGIEWEYNIHGAYKRGERIYSNVYNSRTEAESAAFEKSFEILEQKLNSK